AVCAAVPSCSVKGAATGAQERRFWEPGVLSSRAEMMQYPISSPVCLQRKCGATARPPSIEPVRTAIISCAVECAVDTLHDSGVRIPPINTQGAEMAQNTVTAAVFLHSENGAEFIIAAPARRAV